jgi:hypothetical protein
LITNWNLLKNKKANFWSRSRKAKILTADIHLVFQGLKLEPDTEIGQKGLFKKVSKEGI